MVQTKILIAEDHTIVAEGLSSLLKDHYEVVGIVKDGKELIKTARELQPDVIVTDLSLPFLSGIDALHQLKKEGIKSIVVFLTMHSEPHLVQEAIKEGAAAYLLKESAGEELIIAIQEVLKGHIYLSPSITKAALGKLNELEKNPAAKLTHRQRQVLRLLSHGRSMKEVAAVLNISARTVETYKYEMMRSLGIKTSAELIRFAVRIGLADEATRF
ncbi:response regulator transcription factor [bacterium]|nr:response regulator transcription factor [bacterium]